MGMGLLLHRCGDDDRHGDSVSFSELFLGAEAGSGHSFFYMFQIFLYRYGHCRLLLVKKIIPLLVDNDSVSGYAGRVQDDMVIHGKAVIRSLGNRIKLIVGV